MTTRLSRAASWLALAATLTLAACSAPAAEPPAPTGESLAATAAAQAPTALALPVEAPRIVDGRLVVPGRAVPEYNLELGFERTGPVVEIMVGLGDEVQAGDPIARLDTRALALDVESSKAALNQAQADYEALLSGATPAEVAQAQARLNRARGNLQKVAGEVTAADLEAARKSLEEKQARLDQLLAGNKPEVIAAAQALVDEDRAALASTRDRASAEKTIAESKLAEAANVLRNAQDRYSRIAWDHKNRYGAEVPQPQKDIEAAALREAQNAESRLAQAQVEADQARQQETNLIAAAEARLKESESDLALLTRGPDADDIAAARADLASAQARVNSLSGDERAGSLTEAQAQVDEAQASLERLTADPATTDMAVVEAKVVRAEVALKQAELSLEQATLRAPAAGMVAAIDMAVGKVVEQREAVLTLASLSSWQVLIEDLNELNVVHIREGDEAVIHFFALPTLELKGRVERIETRGRSDKNVGTVYSVIVRPETWDDRLRWNMSASVAIIPAGS